MTTQLRSKMDLRRPAIGRGGWRPGAGRKRGSRVSHDRREAFRPTHPVHVTMRVRPEAAGLRRRRTFDVVRRCIAAASTDTFRVCEFNVMSNHVHLVCEAGGAAELARGMQVLATLMAVRVNRRLGRRGKVFADRYHARVMRSPRQVRATLVYVLQNARHHGMPSARRLAWDPWSSAATFDGWSEALPRGEAWQALELDEPRATVPARSWLLTTGWRRHGAIRIDEAPAG